MMTFARKVYGLKKRKGKAMENAFDEMLKERPDLFSSDGYSGTAVMALRRNVKLALSNLGEMSLEVILVVVKSKNYHCSKFSISTMCSFFNEN